MHDLKRGQSPKLFALVVAGVLGLSACGGPDLGKQNFPRTTVAASGGDTGSGPITDPAVTVAALRPLLPCQFLDQASLTPLGAPEGEPEAETVSFAECRAKVKDAGGKEISVTAEVGAIVVFASDKTTGQVGGLPQVEVPDQTGGSCSVSALTSRTPNLGLTFDIDYSGGDPCAAGRTLLRSAVPKLHNSPQKYPEAKGSVVTADPCTMLDQSAVDGVVKNARPEATGLHSCQWGDSGTIAVRFNPGVPPVEGGGWVKTDVGTASQAFAKKGTGPSSTCEVQWQHRPWQGEGGELVQVQYTNYNAQADQDDPCGKVTGLAKQVATKLPRP
ncbi:DUF3558 domain-containing protein [Amycolatopsis sp. FDAARGOS 1241]|uniref:DUF3558 domain-containing protein n=1 Tax=Amycolatopsis sp. FDAARGOS 1241 TaxID=2778070 RepID=UPI001EF1E20E|nr:DUF3558 domain-containing protein [Amycolatopsis sp. FDAARGOS 1241]